MHSSISAHQAERCNLPGGETVSPSRSVSYHSVYRRNTAGSTSPLLESGVATDLEAAQRVAVAQSKISDSSAQLLLALQQREDRPFAQLESFAIQTSSSAAQPPLPPPPSPVLGFPHRAVRSAGPSFQSFRTRSPPIWRPAVDKIDQALLKGIVSAGVAAETVEVLQRGELSSVRCFVLCCGYVSTLSQQTTV